MAAPLIKVAPVYRWPGQQLQTVRVTVTPRTGLTLADYGTITLTVREDPEHPRTGVARAEADTADPVSDGWPVSTSAVGTVADSVVEFDVTVPAGAGYRRYAFDVVASGGTAGRVQIVESTWLTVTPSLLA